MNIDKQDERLLHEILSKYKQGIISGLYPGNNITFTPTGCRDKIISSTSSGTEGGIQSIQEGTNITVDNTDPENPIISATDNASALFPNGIEIVVVSRDFLTTDKGKLLALFGGVTVTMPSEFPFSDGDLIGIYSTDAAASFETFTGGQVFPFAIDGISFNETLIVKATINEFISMLSPMSSSYIDDNGTLKTALRYLYDQSQNAIPLTGTEAGNPVTGDIKIQNDLLWKMYNNQASIDIPNDRSGIGLTSKFADLGGNDVTFVLTEYAASVSSSFASFQGFSGVQDFTANITELDYTQKIYVGFRGTATLSSGTVTVATDKIKTGYKIYLSVNTPSGTQGFLSAPTGSIVNETEFVINSTSATDDSTVNWWIAP